MLCGCSPVEVPAFRLIIKDNQDNDLLDPSRDGSFDKDDIRITYKENGVDKDVSFSIREPFSYGEDLRNKFPFHQLISQQLGVLRTSDKSNEFFMDLGDGHVYSFSFDYNLSNGYPENLRIDGVAAQYEPSFPEIYGKMYYLLK